MNPRNRIFMLIGILFIISLCWYFFSTQHSSDLQLIGTVDANEVVVSSRIPGRIQALNVDEGDSVHAGQLIATIESDDLAAAQKAAAATAESQRYKLQGASDTERQTRGGMLSQLTNAEAQLQSAQAALVQAQAQYEHQDADTSRTVALAAQGITSYQSRDEAATALNAARATVDSAKANVAAAEASVKVAEANTIQAQAAAKTVSATRGEMENARAMVNQADISPQSSFPGMPAGVGDARPAAARMGAMSSEVLSPTPPVECLSIVKVWSGVASKVSPE